LAGSIDDWKWRRLAIFAIIVFFLLGPFPLMIRWPQPDTSKIVAAEVVIGDPVFTHLETSRDGVSSYTVEWQTYVRDWEHKLPFSTTFDIRIVQGDGTVIERRTTQRIEFWGQDVIFPIDLRDGGSPIRDINVEVVGVQR
jgi:hypothetical protein